VKVQYVTFHFVLNKQHYLNVNTSSILHPTCGFVLTWLTVISLL